MSLINFLSFLEISKVNNKLDEINRSNEANNQARESAEVQKSIIRLFQDLVNHQNNIQLIDLSEVSRIQQHINNEFNIIKFDKPKRTIKEIVLLASSGALSIYWYKISYVGFFFGAVAMVSFIYFILCVIKEIQIHRYDKHTKEFEHCLVILKAAHPNLSAYGVFLKWYLYSKNFEIKELLKQDCSVDLDITMKKIFEIFNVQSKTDYFIEVENKLLENFNEDLIKQYNLIKDDEINAYDNQ